MKRERFVKRMVVCTITVKSKWAPVVSPIAAHFDEKICRA